MKALLQIALSTSFKWNYKICRLGQGDMEYMSQRVVILWTTTHILHFVLFSSNLPNFHRVLSTTEPLPTGECERTRSEECSNCPLLHTWVHRLPRMAGVVLINQGVSDTMLRRNGFKFQAIIRIESAPDDTLNTLMLHHKKTFDWFRIC